MISIVVTNGSRLKGCCAHLQLVHIVRNLSTLPERFLEMQSIGSLKEDPRQLQLLKVMEKLRKHIETCDFQVIEQQHDQLEFKKKRESIDKLEVEVPHPVSRLRGLYIHGPVGSGKTMLMDMLFRDCNIQLKRRVHFHEFLLDVHRRIHEHKQSSLQQINDVNDMRISKNAASGRDSIRYVGKMISAEAKLLCFDEFQVTDICDALILTKLFDELWSRGTVLIATSNRPPTELYLNGLNRHDFLPFINRIQKECIVKCLDGEVDYRVANRTTDQSIYHTPISEENSGKLLQSYFQELEELQEKQPVVSGNCEKRDGEGKIIIPISGSRHFTALYGNTSLGICFTDFQTLCLDDRGASDYRALTKHFHTIFIDKIPILSKQHHNSARRFITLIDELYNAKVRLRWVSDAEPFQMFQEIEDSNCSVSIADRIEAFQAAHSNDEQFPKYGRNYQPAKVADLNLSSGQQEELDVFEGELAAIKELDFAFKRAASRLIEMSSRNYLQEWEKNHLT